MFPPGKKEQKNRPVCPPFPQNRGSSKGGHGLHRGEQKVTPGSQNKWSTTRQRDWAVPGSYFMYVSGSSGTLRLPARAIPSPLSGWNTRDWYRYPSCLRLYIRIPYAWVITYIRSYLPAHRSSSSYNARYLSSARREVCHVWSI